MAPAAGTAGVVATRLQPTPGQLGGGFTVSSQQPAQARGDDPPPAEPTYPFSAARAFRLPASAGGARFMVAAQHQEGTEGVPAPVTVGLTGAPQHVNVIEEHGPAVIKVKRSWWPFGRKKDSRGETDENVIPAVGGRDIAGVAAPTYAAVSAENQFVIPDTRRINADPRNVVDGRAGYPLTPTALESSPYTLHTEHAGADVVNMEDVTVRPRAGAADPRTARPATVPRWLFQRPFDQWAAHHSPGLKGVQGPPRVSLPTFTRKETDAVGQPGYHVSTPAPGMTPLGLQPNTWRVVPQAWDQDLVNTGVSPEPMISGASGIAISSRQAARGWALR